MIEAFRTLTISGLPGSGTSTVSRGLQQRLGWEYVNAGMIFRKLANEEGISLATLGTRAQTDPSIDQALDRRIVDIARGHTGILIEGRITGWMLHRHGLSALKVWLGANSQIRAKRVAQREGDAFEVALQDMTKREGSERQRYKDIHDINIADLSIYDLVVDTEKYQPPAVIEQIITRMEV